LVVVIQIDHRFLLARQSPRSAHESLWSGQQAKRILLESAWAANTSDAGRQTLQIFTRSSQMNGHGAKFGQKKEEAIVALLTQRNVEEAPNR